MAKVTTWKSESAMSKIGKSTLRLAAASVIALVPAGASLADPGLPNAARHQHYIVTPDGELVPVGPDFCANPNLQDAFNQFHFNVHHSEVRVGNVIVPVDTLGPQHGAPGLHDGNGAELTAGRCG
jgi:hypothetical protein